MELEIEFVCLRRHFRYSAVLLFLKNESENGGRGVERGRGIVALVCSIISLGLDRVSLALRLCRVLVALEHALCLC
jgi:hypothetical protein